jgi:hypothetical protein
MFQQISSSAAQAQVPMGSQPVTHRAAVRKIAVFGFVCGSFSKMLYWQSLDVREQAVLTKAKLSGQACHAATSASHMVGMHAVHHTHIAMRCILQVASSSSSSS